MKKNRLFTFGCSHTLYHWPTWADMIGLDYDKHYNFGRPGLGNFAILNNLIRVIDHFDITKNDTILILLTSWDRIDYYGDYETWDGIGGITGDEAKTLFGETFIRNHIDNKLYELERTFTYIKTLKTILNNIGCKYKIKNAFPNDNPSELNENEMLRNNSTYKKILQMCEGFDSLYKKDRDYMKLTYFYIDQNKKLIGDGHLKIEHHLEFCKTSLGEFYNKKNDKTILEWQNNIVTKRKVLDNHTYLIHEPNRTNMYFKPTFWYFQDGELKKHRFVLIDDSKKEKQSII